MEISKTFTFEAAHILPRHPGKCSRLHGHSWVLTVFVKGPINSDTGFVLDYGDIKEAVQPLVSLLDHSYLGQIVLPAGLGSRVEMLGGLYPSSENLLLWIAEKIELSNWSKLTLNETCTSSCTLTREEFDASKQ